MFKQETKVFTLDLEFMGVPGSIATYLIPHLDGAVLVECGPGSTIPALKKGLHKWGFSEADVSHVLLTHIHLDHAGAAGWLAHQGARILVHPIGAPHLLNPEKLLSSAARLYGDAMQTMWGEFLPVPEDCLAVVQDCEEIEIEGLHFRALNTPGHADHHMCYLFEDICFTGDIGGVRLNNQRYLRIPMPPPEFHLEQWRASLRRLLKEFDQGAFQRIAPTHFGIFDDPSWHLHTLSRTLDDIEAWMEAIMPSDPPIEQLNEAFLAWSQQTALQQGVEPSLIQTYEVSNPSWMSPFGIQRYWRKYRQEAVNSTPS